MLGWDLMGVGFYFHCVILVSVFHPIVILCCGNSFFVKYAGFNSLVLEGKSGLWLLAVALYECNTLMI